MDMLIVPYLDENAYRLVNMNTISLNVLEEKFLFHIWANLPVSQHESNVVCQIFRVSKISIEMSHV